jgi:hypothetical protein
MIPRGIALFDLQLGKFFDLGALVLPDQRMQLPTDHRPPG